MTSAACPELAIVLPTLNEKDNLRSLLNRIDAALVGIAWEAIVVDDNSPDGTGDAARALARSDARLRVMQRFGRRGLSSAAIEGMCATAAPYVAVMDADLQHDPALLPQMLRALGGGNAGMTGGQVEAAESATGNAAENAAENASEKTPNNPTGNVTEKTAENASENATEKTPENAAEKADVALASRFIQGGSAAGLDGRARKFASHWANRVARKVTGTDISDPMSGYFMMKTRLLRGLAPQLSGIGFKILLDILIASKSGSSHQGLNIREFPLHFAPRLSGQSKLDRAVLLEFWLSIYQAIFGRILPVRFLLFATVGALGVLVHMSILALLFRVIGSGFSSASLVATLAAMSFNFCLNNWMTYRDWRLRGFWPSLKGWAGFCAACSIGAVANVAVASFLEMRDIWWVAAALSGILVGAVWNFALSSKFVWRRY